MSLFRQWIVEYSTTLDVHSDILFPSYIAISALNNVDLPVSRLARANGATVKFQRAGLLHIYKSTYIFRAI